MSHSALHGLRHGILHAFSHGGVLPLGNQAIALLLGDSNVFGEGNANPVAAVNEFGVDTAFSPVTIASLGAINTNDPPPFGAEFGPTPLVSFAPGSVPGYGAEITLGRALNAISSSFAYVVKCGVVGSFLGTHWAPNGTYGSSLPGGNLYKSQVIRAHTYENLTGRTVKLIWMNLGTNDASDSTQASNFQANMAAMVTQLHTDFPNAVIVWPLTQANTVQTFLSTVRTAQLNYAATAPSYFMLINNDNLGLRDSFHFNDNGYLTLGTDVAYAGADLLGISRPTFTQPTLIGNGVTESGSALTLSPVSWPGTLDNDWELLIAVGGGTSAGTIGTPSGWTAVTNGQTTNSGFVVTWAVFKRKVPVGEIATNSVPPSKDRRAAAVNVTFTVSTDNMAKRITVRGASDVDVAASTVLNAFGTGPFSLGSLTAASNNSQVIWAVGGLTVANTCVSTLTNGGLTNMAKFTESFFPMPSTHTGQLGVWSANANAGATGADSLSFSQNTVAFAAKIIMKP